MFRAQQNTFDESVAKATDENLTSENWEYIMDVVDKVGPQDARANDVVAALIKRLAHRNANVQLYTLELANALSQNCGPNLHRELASRSFTDALLRLAGDRNTHTQVKAKILERMEEWSRMFSKNPDLGIMEQAYVRLKSQNPNLHPPSKPVKSQITEVDRRKEEEELQMALALSIKDKAGSTQASAKQQSKASATTSDGSSAALQPTASSSANTSTAGGPTAVPSGTTAATVSRVRALYDFQPSEPGELQFRKGDIIAVLESVYKDWWKGSLRGQTGIFPLNYVEKLQDPTKEELEREAQMEAEVFAQIRNVEKLLALLSTSSKTGIRGGGEGDIRENEGITELYHSTLAIRPKLIELIGKYSQKKDDFTQLNEKFIKARRDYESLLEASMAQPPHHQQPYGRPAYGYPGPSAYAGVSPAPQHRYPLQGHPHQQGSPAPHDQYPQQHQHIMHQPAQSAYQLQQQQDPSPQANPQQYYPTPMPGQVNPQQPFHQNGEAGPVGAGVGASGFPSELATTTYDLPIDNPQNVLASHMPHQQQQPNGYPQQQQQSQPHYNSYSMQHPYSSVPPTQIQIQSTQQQPLHDSPTSIYTSGPDGQAYPPSQPATSSVSASVQSSAPVPSVLQPYGVGGGQQYTQAYVPAQQQQQAGGVAPNPAAYPPSSSGYVAYQPGMLVVGQDGDGRRTAIE